MIAFEELSAALDRWRIRNGLPVVGDELPASPLPEPAAAPAVPAYAAAPATMPRPATDGDVVSLDDADVAAEEDLYDNDGNDFAMSFGGAPAAGAAEPTGHGPVPGTAEAPAMPAGTLDQPYDAAAYGEPPAAYADPSDAYAQPDAVYAEASDGYAPPPADALYEQAAADPYQGSYQDPAYDEPQPLADGYEAEAYPAEPAPEPEAEDEDAEWARLYPGAGGSGDTIDAEAEVIDEATVVGDERHRS